MANPPFNQSEVDRAKLVTAAGKVDARFPFGLPTTNNANYKGPAHPSPRLGCDTHQTVTLNIVRRPKATPIHELERYMRCKDCSQVRGYPYKRKGLLEKSEGRPVRSAALYSRWEWRR